MEGPPVKFHNDPNANPIKLNKPAPVPLHWQKQVLEELNRDIALGVLERVPYGQPTEWCFRMVVTRKKDGSLRRTVDLYPLNKFCLRKAHSSRSPFQHGLCHTMLTRVFSMLGMGITLFPFARKTENTQHSLRHGAYSATRELPKVSYQVVTPTTGDLMTSLHMLSD